MPLPTRAGTPMRACISTEKLWKSLRGRMVKRRQLLGKRSRTLPEVKEKTRQRSILSLGLFLVISFTGILTMVLSLTSDELVQVHFDALIEEGQQKQVSRERRGRSVDDHCTPCSRSLALALPYNLFFLPNVSPVNPPKTGRPRRGEVRLQARPRCRGYSNPSCRRKGALCLRSWRERNQGLVISSFRVSQHNKLRQSLLPFIPHP